MKPSPFASLENLCHPWIGAADDDELMQRFARFDSNDKSCVIAAARADLRPHFLLMPSGEREAVITALVVAQAMGGCEVERFWESMLPPFSLPEKPESLFVWIGEALSG